MEGSGGNSNSRERECIREKELGLELDEWTVVYIGLDSH